MKKCIVPAVFVLFSLFGIIFVISDPLQTSQASVQIADGPPNPLSTPVSRTV
jgi:hypothetical protein